MLSSGHNPNFDSASATDLKVHLPYMTKPKPSARQGASLSSVFIETLVLENKIIGYTLSVIFLTSYSCLCTSSLHYHPHLFIQ